jgi:hypothetical protein
LYNFISSLTFCFSQLLDYLDGNGLHLLLVILYKVLVGRSLLAGFAIINSSASLVYRIDKDFGDIDVGWARSRPDDFLRDILTSYCARWVGTQFQENK